MSHSPASTGDDFNIVRLDTTYGDGVAQVIIHGEADFSTLKELDAGLEQVQFDDSKVIHLDVSGLGFADTAAIGRLAVFARHVKHAGHEMVTYGANPTLRRVAGEMGVQDDLGLV